MIVIRTSTWGLEISACSSFMRGPTVLFLKASRIAFVRESARRVQFVYKKGRLSVPLDSFQDIPWLRE